MMGWWRRPRPTVVLVCLVTVCVASVAESAVNREERRRPSVRARAAVVMDAKTGKINESIYINADPGRQGLSVSSPMVVDGRVYVGSETGGLRCYGNND